MDPLENVLARLPLAKRSGQGWSARCPAHDDRKASLSVACGDDGRVLLHCHAGCSVEAIVQALGLQMRDLFPPATGPARNGQPTTGGRTFATAKAAIAELERQYGKRSALWIYYDAQSQPVGVVVRWDKPGGKDIRPIARHADGWCLGAMPAPRPLYNLPSLAAARRVVVCEGEKVADVAQALGFVATTSAGGAQAARKTDWNPLRNKDILIFPDHDTAGEHYAATVAQLVTAAGAASVRILRLADHAPQLPEGGDLVDILADERWCGLPLGDAATPKDLAALLERLADATPRWQPEAMAAAEKRSRRKPDLVYLTGVAPCPVSWLWPGRIPMGRLTLLVGRPGEGKSFLTIDAASRVSTGTPWPDGRTCPKGSVILMAAEDDPADTIRPRLDAHAADVSRVCLLTTVRCVDDQGTYEQLITLADVDVLEEALRQLPDCRLLVVDPVGSFLGGKVDAHRDNEVRGVLAPLAALAKKYGIAVLVVAHRRKSTGSSADDLTLGSRAFTGIARAIWHLTRDPHNRSRRLLVPGKNNLASSDDGLAFSISGDPPRVVWERDPVAMSADDVLAVENQQPKPGPEADALKVATDWLRAALASGPRLAKELYDEWKNGHSGSKRTLERAKQLLPVEVYRPEVPGPWWWRLAPNMATTSESG